MIFGAFIPGTKTQYPEISNYSIQMRTQIHHISSLVTFDSSIQKAVELDLSDQNPELFQMDILDMDTLENFIGRKIKEAHAVFGYGGYGELREFYRRSQLFGETVQGISGEPRRFHLGMDIWGKEGTEVFAPMEGEVHSFAFNNHMGDYGATIILWHPQKEAGFHTLYGHLSLRDLEDLRQGVRVQKGQLLGHFGCKEENGQWPAHLHFQIVRNMESKMGDYPGVCGFNERARYLENCPDPRYLTPF